MGHPFFAGCVVLSGLLFFVLMMDIYEDVGGIYSAAKASASKLLKGNNATQKLDNHFHLNRSKLTKSSPTKPTSNTTYSKNSTTTPGVNLTIGNVAGGAADMIVETEIKTSLSKTGNESNHSQPETGRDHSKEGGTDPIRSSENKEGRITYVPFPHNDIGIGDEAVCDWTAFTGKLNGLSAATLSNLIGSNGVQDYDHVSDFIQRLSLKETICIPRRPKFRSKLHLFSTKEAKTCLANVTLTLSGDSYTKQLFLGLLEILTAKVSSREIHNARERNILMIEAVEWLDRKKALDSTFPDLNWIGTDEGCYPIYDQGRSLDLCTESIQEFRRSRFKQNSKNNKTQPSDMVNFVGVGVHLHGPHLKEPVPPKVSRERAAKEIRKLAMNLGQVIIPTMPSYNVQQIPEQYRDAMNNTGGLYFDFVSRPTPQIKLMDVFQMTHACYFQNCSLDGGHRNRWVNRWKAQMLLNMLCTFTPPS